MIDFGAASAAPYQKFHIAVAPQPTAARHHPPALTLSGHHLTIIATAPTARADVVMGCRIGVPLAALPHLCHRLHHRAANHRHSGLVINGMVLLLALCGWIAGGEDGATWALTGGTLSPHATPPAISPEAMAHQFGARPIQPHHMPGLFAMLADIAHRAGLPRLPDLYLLPDRAMNAYALGGPDHAAITLTQGLLHGLSPAELAGILAHEVAHIRNHDTWAMNLAGALHRSTTLVSLMGLARRNDAAANCPLQTVLTNAPAIGRLLHLALSRLREFDADALALELVDDPHTLVAALHKLEHHHAPHAAPRPQSPASRFLRSHPDTWERVSQLHRLAVPGWR